MVTLQQIQVHPSHALKETIAQMEYLENKSLSNPYFVKWVNEKFGSNCLPCIPGKIWKYMVNNFEFKKDSPQDEVLIAPYLMNEIRKGDCDDFALFAKTCMDILGGWSVHYFLLGKERNAYTHIAVFAHRGVNGTSFIDPIVIDGVNSSFNIIPTKYNYYKIL